MSLPLWASAQDFMQLRNEATLARGFGLPALGGATLVAPGAWRGSVAWDLANEYYAGADADQSLLLDGETSTLRARYAQGFGASASGAWEASLELPLLIRGGGMLDGAIENWHAAFGLPEGGREQAAQGDYRFAYQREGRTLLDLDESGTGLGDVLLGLGWSPRTGLSLRGQLQLPAGDADRLTGGAWGGALWAEWALPLGQGSRWSGYLAGGAALHETRGPLADLQEPALAFGGAGLGFRLAQGWELLAQVQAHSRLYDAGGLDPFRPGLPLALGLRYCLRNGASVEAGFQEDPITNVSPDFALHLAFRAF